MNWSEAGAGNVYANERVRVAGDIMLEAGPRPRRFYARAAGLEQLDKAQLRLIIRWKHVGVGQGSTSTCRHCNRLRSRHLTQIQAPIPLKEQA